MNSLQKRLVNVIAKLSKQGYTHTEIGARVCKSQQTITRWSHTPLMRPDIAIVNKLERLVEKGPRA